MYPTKKTVDSTSDAWRRTAQSRLRFELAGLAFALQHGSRPEDYARHLWSKGAKGWMGKTKPNAAEYLLRESQCFRQFYPEISFEIVAAGDEKAELVFSDGCLGSGGEDRWTLAKNLGLTKRDICAYCRESFLVWAKQLGLVTRIGPNEGGACRLQALIPGDITE